MTTNFVPNGAYRVLNVDEPTGYRAKTRFAKFFNIPELISLFKESADIQTPDMLKLPVPEAEYENVVLKPSEHQKEMVKSLADRAEAVRSGAVEPTVDNLLKITFVATLKGKMGHEVELGADALGNLQRMNNLLDGMTVKLEETNQKLLHVERQLETAKTEVTKPFAQETELKEKQERLNTLNSLLNMNEKDFSMLGADNPETDTPLSEMNISYESKAASNQTIVAEDVVYDFRQKTENLFHEIGGQSASEIEQTVWDYIDS